MTELNEFEKWREEYCSLLRNPLADFEVHEFLGFCKAKRSQKVIELPYLPRHISDECQWTEWLYREVENSIKRAGYKYTIEGE